MGSKGGGGGSGSNSMSFQNTTSTYTPNPEAMAAYRRALSMAENVTSQPYQPYQGQMTAGFTPDQMAAMQGVRNMQGMVQPYINTATNLTNQAVNMADPRNFSQNTLQQYFNPYQQNVIDATMANLEATQNMANKQAQQNAGLRGAFGGSSGAAMGRAEVARQQSLANAQTLSGLQQSGYQQAVGQYNQQQQQAIQTAQNAAYGLGQLGNQAQQASLQGIQALLGTGGQQQQLAQQQLTGAYNQWLQAQAFPYQQTAFYSGIAGGIAPNMGGTTNTVGFGMGNQQQSGGGGGGGGGAGGAISSVMSMLPAMFGMSDERTKTNIEEVGTDEKTGLPLYAYDDIADVKAAEHGDRPLPPKRVSIMAQDLESIEPESVVDFGGLKGIANDRVPAAAGGAQGGTGTGDAAGQSSTGSSIYSPSTTPDAANIQNPSASNQTSGGVASLGQLGGQGGMDPGMSSFLQSAFDPRTADQMARAKWVNQPQALGDQPQTGDNYVIPPSLMNDGGAAYQNTAYHPQPGSPMAHGGRAEKAGGGGLGSFFDLVKQGGSQGPFSQAPDNYMAQAQEMGLGKIIPQARDVAKEKTESAASSMMSQLAKDTGGKGGGAPSGGGGGGAPKMPDMKGMKGKAPTPSQPGFDPGSAPTPAAGGAGGSSGAGQTGTPAATDPVSDANKQAGAGFNFQEAAPAIPQSPAVEQMNAPAPEPAPEMAPPAADFAAAAPQIPEIPLVGMFGGFRDGGRVHRDGGGAAGGAGGPTLGAGADGSFGPADMNSPNLGAGFGDLALGKAPTWGDAAGFGNIKAGQENLTGENLMNKLTQQYWARDPGEQKSPTEQGMPAMPDAKYYQTPRKDLPSVTQTEHYGEENQSEIPGLMMMAGLGSGKGLGTMGAMGLGMQINAQHRAADAAAKRAELTKTRSDMLSDPANFPVQGYFSQINSTPASHPEMGMQINPRTGLYNMQYTGAYRGYPYKDGGRVAKGVGGSLSPEEEAAIEQRMNQIIRAESRGKATAQNPHSSAGGLGQFIDKTWLAYARKTNPELRNVPNGQVLALKKNATPEGIQFQKDVLRTFTRENAMRLKAEGLPVTPQNLYSVHFSGNTKIAHAAPGTPMSRILDSQARAANPGIARMTVGQFNNEMSKRMGTGQLPTQVAERPRAVPFDPTKPSLAYNVMANQAPRIPFAKPSEKPMSWSSPGRTEPTVVAQDKPTATRGYPMAGNAPAGSILHRLNPADPSGPPLAEGALPAKGATAAAAPAPKARGLFDKLASEFSPVGTAHAAEAERYPGDAKPFYSNPKIQKYWDERPAFVGTKSTSEAASQRMSDKEAADAIGRGEKLHFDAAGNAVRNAPVEQPKSAPGFVPEAAPTQSIVAKGNAPAPGFVPTTPPVDGTGLPRIDTGPAVSAGDRPAWNQNASTPAQSGEGIPSIDKGVAGPQDPSPGYHMPEYTYAPGVQEQEDPMMTGFGSHVRNKEYIEGADLIPGQDRRVSSRDFPLTMAPTDNGAGFSHERMGPEAPETATPKEQTPAAADKPAEGAATGQKYWGDWRDAEPWKSDPIGGAFDTLMGDTPQADKPGTWTPGESAGLDLGSMFNFAKGGAVRRGYDEGGEVDPIDPLQALSGGLGEIGEGIGNAVSSIGEGFGNLLSGGQQPVAASDSAAAPASQPAGSDFFTRWSENPLSQLLWNAGQSMMAHPNAPIHESIIGAMPHAMVAGKAGAERAAEQAKLKAAEDYQRSLDGSVETAGAGAPTEGGAPAEGGGAEKTPASQDAGAGAPQAPSLQNELNAAISEYRRVAAKPAVGEQIKQKKQWLDMKRQEIELLKSQMTSEKVDWKQAGVDDYGNPIFMYTSGPHAGDIVDPSKMGKTPAGQDVTGQPTEREHGEDFLRHLSPSDQEMVLGLVDGSIEPPKGVKAAKYKAWAKQYDQSWNEDKYREIRDMRKGYAPQGKIGQQIEGASAAMGHIDRLLTLAPELKNRSFTPWNMVANPVTTMMGSDAVNNFETVRDALVGEVEKYLKGGAPASAEIHRALDRVKSSGSPQQIIGGLHELSEIMGSKTREYQKSWNDKLPNEPLPVDMETMDRVQNRLEREFEKYHPKKSAEPTSSSEKSPAGEGQKPSTEGRQVVKTGIYNGRKVVQYSDGTMDYAD